MLKARETLDMNKNNTILIVDDSGSALKHLQTILENAGYKTITASSGNEAISVTEKMKPDAVMLDIIMDDGDGYKACRTIKKNPSTTETPIIMVSSKSNPVDKQWAATLGAVDYIVKPYENQEVLEKIEAI